MCPQEFLSAACLARRDRFAAECKRLAQAHAGHWQVVLPVAARLAGPERGALAADELVGGVAVTDPLAPHPPLRTNWDQALLAGLQLQEIGVDAVNSSPSGQATLRRVADGLAASLPVHPSNGGADAPQRAYAGEVLATLGRPTLRPQPTVPAARPLAGLRRGARGSGLRDRHAALRSRAGDEGARLKGG